VRLSSLFGDEILGLRGVDVLVTERDGQQLFNTDASKVRQLISAITFSLVNRRQSQGRIRLLAEFQPSKREEALPQIMPSRQILQLDWLLTGFDNAKEIEELFKSS
jgi:hypothetical protein